MKTKRILINLLFLALGAVIAIFAMSHMHGGKRGELSSKHSESHGDGSFDLQQHLRDVRSGRLNDETKKSSKAPRSRVTDGTADPAPQNALSQLQPNELSDLIRRVFSDEASDEEQLAFWNEMRNSDQIDRILSSLEGDVETNPSNVDSRLNLAQVYMAKLHSGSMGPEMKVWATKAEQQWKEVLSIDPSNLDAQSSLAEGLSWYPDNMNRMGEAIGEYEKLITLQEEVGAEQGFADSYLDLARLHLRNGDPGGSLNAIERGLEMFPGDANLQQQLTSLHNQYDFTGE
ncbi:MAG: hypothetical protein AAGC74_07400 [Verrucomicrobiota bacterium]